jgi:transcriptional regulator with XRE-family HTH domain
MSFGTQVKKYRNAAGLTYAGLEELSGVGVGSINAAEKRGSETSKHAPALAKALGLTLDQLLDEATDYSEHVRQHITTQRTQAEQVPSNVVMSPVAAPWPATYWPFTVARDRVKAALSQDDLARVDAFMLALVQTREQELVKNSVAVSNGRH